LKTRALGAATLLCLALLALLAVIQVVHTHAAGTDADRCPICVVIHTVAPVAAAAPMVVLVQVDRPAPAFEPRSIVRYWHATLFTRPPPSGC
jgi:hypothetical protein